METSQLTFPLSGRSSTRGPARPPLRRCRSRQGRRRRRRSRTTACILLELAVLTRGLDVPLSGRRRNRQIGRVEGCSGLLLMLLGLLVVKGGVLGVGVVDRWSRVPVGLEEVAMCASRGGIEVGSGLRCVWDIRGWKLWNHLRLRGYGCLLLRLGMLTLTRRC